MYTASYLDVYYIVLVNAFVTPACSPAGVTVLLHTWSLWSCVACCQFSFSAHAPALQKHFIPTYLPYLPHLLAPSCSYRTTFQWNLQQCITHSSNLIKRHIMQVIPKKQPHLYVLAMALVRIVVCCIPCMVVLPAHTHHVTCWTRSPEVLSNAGQRPVQNVNNCNQL